MSQQNLITWDGARGVAQSSAGPRCTLARKPDIGFDFERIFFNAGSGSSAMGDETHDLSPTQIAACEAFCATLAAMNNAELVFAVDAAGEPLGWVARDALPAAAVIVPPAPAGSGLRWSFSPGRWFRPDDVAASRAAALEAIDAEAEVARLRFISPGAGMAATYLMKGQQARAYINDGYQGPPPPFIAAEAHATGRTPSACADEIHAIAMQWQDQLAPAIEAARRRAKIAIEMAPDFATIETALALATAQLQTFRP